MPNNMTPQGRKALSDAAKARFKGKSKSPEHRAKIAAASTGRKKSDAERKKISEAAKRQHAAGRSYRHPKGWRHSDEGRANIREGQRRFRERLGEEEYRKFVLARNHKAFKWKKPTGIEKLTAGILDEIGVEYIQQYPIFKYEVDFYIPEWNTVIEVNGCWWHRCKQCGHKDDIRARFRDARRYRSLRSRGYEVIVIWEHDLEEVVLG